MADGLILGDGVIRVSADRTAFDAGIAQAKVALQEFGKTVGDSVATGSAKAEAALNNLGKTFGASAEAGTTRAQRQLEAYIGKVEAANNRIGKSFSDIKIAQFAQRGVSDDQLQRLADVLKTTEALKEQAREEKKLAADRAASAAKLPVVTAGFRATVIGNAQGAGNIAQLDAEAQAAQRAEKAERALASFRVAAQTDLQRGGAIATQLDIETAAAQRATAAERALAGIRASAQEAARREFQAGQSFLASLESEVGAIGKSRSELLALQAAKRGVSEQAAPLIAQLAAEEKALKGVAAAGKLTSFQQQQLGFQVHDFVVQVASGQSPLTALVQQGSQLSGTFGGAGNAFKAVLTLFTPLRLAIGGAAAALGALAYAFIEGSNQSKAFADAIVNTGNFAGQTEGKFNALVRSVATSTHSAIGNVRELAQALISTGEIGPQTFAAATAAVVGYAATTGKSADEVAKDFAAMARAPSRFASEANRQLNFLTAAQYASIKAFEDQGRSADAQGVVLDALNARYPKLNANLGYLDRALREAKNKWSDFWNAAYDIGRPETIEDRIAKTQAKLANVNPRPAVADNAGGAAFVAQSSGKRRSVIQQTLSSLQDEQAENLREQFEKSFLATTQAAFAERQKKGIAAIDFKESMDIATKSVDALNKALAENERQFKAAADVGQPFTETQKARINEETRKRLTDPELLQFSKASLDGKLKALDDALQRERDALTFQNAFVRNNYTAGNTSLAALFAAEKSQRDTALADELATLDKKKAALKAYRATIPAFDRSEIRATDTRIKEIDNDKEKLRIDAANAETLANQQNAESFRALNNSVIEYRASLLQLQGDEVGAAKLRAQIAIENARILAGQARPTLTSGDVARFDRGASLPQNPVDVAGQQKALNDQIALTAARTRTSQVNELLQQEEERIALTQRTGALEEFAALQKTSEARQRAVAELEKIVAAQEEVAKSRPQDFQLQIDTSRARLELEKLKDEADAVKSHFNDIFKEAGSNAIADLLNKKVGIRGALREFVQSVSQSLNADLAKSLSAQLFGNNGLLSGVGNSFGGLFGSKSPNETGIVSGATDAASAATEAAQKAALTTATTSQTTAIATLTASTTAQDAATAALTATTTAQDAAATTLIAAMSGQDLAATTATAALGELATAAQAAAASMASSGGGGLGGLGGLFGMFGSMFGGEAAGGAAASGGEEAFAFVLHSGGVVGETRDKRSVSQGLFADAQKYHGGGVVVSTAARMQGLKAHEVPAVLMGGPKGVREEVLHASDPRHRDNLGARVLEQIKQSAFASARRYHTGGLVGEEADQLLQVAGRQYLMTGVQSSEVRAQATTPQQRPIEQHFHFHEAKPSRETMNQIGARARRGLAEASRNE